MDGWIPKQESFSLIQPSAAPTLALLTSHTFPLQGKRTNLRKTGSDRIAHGMRVKFNPLALLLDSSLEGEFDLVQRIIYEVSFITLYLILKLKIEATIGKSYFKFSFLGLRSCGEKY